MADDTSKTEEPERKDTNGKSRRANMVGITTGYAMGGTAWLVCFYVAWRLTGCCGGVQPDAAKWLNVMTCLVGSIVGWWLGILISPDPTERKPFSSVLKTLSTFISGFALAKIDVFFQGAVAKNMTTDPIFIGRILLFTTTALICAQFTYVARHDLGMYGVAHNPEETFRDRLRFLARRARRKDVKR